MKKINEKKALIKKSKKKGIKKGIKFFYTLVFCLVSWVPCCCLLIACLCMFWNHRFGLPLFTNKLFNSWSARCYYGKALLSRLYIFAVLQFYYINMADYTAYYFFRYVLNLNSHLCKMNCPIVL